MKRIKLLLTIICIMISSCLICNFTNAKADGDYILPAYYSYQNLINNIGRQGSSQCGGYSLAYARTMLDGIQAVPSNYLDSKNNTQWTKAGFTWDSYTNYTSDQVLLQKLYRCIKAGYPAVLFIYGSKVDRCKYEGSSGKCYILNNNAYYLTKNHYVTVVGVSNDTDYNNLKVSDFRVIDPAYLSGPVSTLRTLRDDVLVDPKFDYPNEYRQLYWPKEWKDEGSTVDPIPISISFSSQYVSQNGDDPTDVTFYCDKASANYPGTFSEWGLTIWQGENEIATVKDVGTPITNSYINMWFNSKKYNINLSADTDYTYRFYVVFEGTAYYGEKLTYRTGSVDEEVDNTKQLTEISSLSDVVLENGTTITNDVLPSQVIYKYTQKGNNNQGYASISWDLSDLKYDTSKIEEQKLTIYGQVSIPEDIENTNGLSTTINVNVTIKTSAIENVCSIERVTENQNDYKIACGDEVFLQSGTAQYRFDIINNSKFYRLYLRKPTIVDGQNMHVTNDSLYYNQFTDEDYYEIYLYVIDNGVEKIYKLTNSDKMFIYSTVKPLPSNISIEYSNEELIIGCPISDTDCVGWIDKMKELNDLWYSNGLRIQLNNEVITPSSNTNIPHFTFNDTLSQKFVVVTKDALTNSGVENVETIALSVDGYAVYFPNYRFTIENMKNADSISFDVIQLSNGDLQFKANDDASFEYLKNVQKFVFRSNNSNMSIEQSYVINENQKSIVMERFADFALQSGTYDIDIYSTGYIKKTITGVEIVTNAVSTPNINVFATAKGIVIKSLDREYLEKISNTNNENGIGNDRLTISFYKSQSQVSEGDFKISSLYENNYFSDVYTYEDSSKGYYIYYPREKLLELNPDLSGSYSFSIVLSGYDYLFSNYKVSLENIAVYEFVNSNLGKELAISELDEADNNLNNLYGITVNNNTTGSMQDNIDLYGGLTAAITSDKDGNISDSILNLEENQQVNITYEIDDLDVDIAQKVEQSSIDDIASTGYGFDADIYYQIDDGEANYVTNTTIPVAMEFDIPEDIDLDEDEELKILAIHETDDGETVELLDVEIEDNKGIAYTSKFSKFILVIKSGTSNSTGKDPIINDPINGGSNNGNTSTDSGNSYDDGGPFTTDVCGNVYDRWGNKLYSAPNCALSDGYVVPNTGTK